MYSILIPLYNEEEILEDSVASLEKYLVSLGIKYEILLVDNGSIDKTKEIGLSLQQSNENLRFFSITQRGPGRAFKLGVKEASYPYVISLDVDLSSELAFIDYAKNLLPYGDLVIGSKVMGSQKRSLFRILASQFYIFLTQIMFGLTISDYSIGSKAYRRESILPVLDKLDTWTGYVFEICVYLQIQGKKIIQVGIDCEDTRKSHFNLLFEGYYRYLHIFKVWSRLKFSSSWLQKN